MGFHAYSTLELETRTQRGAEDYAEEISRIKKDIDGRKSALQNVA
jgi:hypothetical protein